MTPLCENKNHSELFTLSFNKRLVVNASVKTELELKSFIENEVPNYISTQSFLLVTLLQERKSTPPKREPRMICSSIRKFNRYYYYFK